MVDFLYKYEPPTAQALENLKAQSIYFGSPQGFNDPYDCATYPFIVAPTELETVQIRSHYLEREQIPDQARREFEIATIESLQEIFLVAGKSAIHTSVENFMSKKGVSQLRIGHSTAQEKSLIKQIFQHFKWLRT